MDHVKRKIHYWCEDTLYRGNRGEGIVVAVLDTGLAPHFDMKNRVVQFKDMVNGREGLYDDSGHGTHVCGILAGDGSLSNGKYAGIAPEASLVVIKVLEENGDGNLEQILRGIQWILRYQKKYDIRIVNLSVGARQGMEYSKERRLIEAVEDMWDAGLAVIVSAGNGGPREGTVTIPGNSRKVITVGSMEQIGHYRGNSGRGPTESCVMKPDVVAPGQNIISCNYQYSGNRPLPYVIKSGTSMSTPVVSGAAALYYAKYPEKGNIDLKLRLRQTCDRRRRIEGQGWGSLRVDWLLA
jgi:serine protease AprX